jgi:hypothetical protein
MWLIRSGRGVERKGRVSCYNFQLNSRKEKNGRTHQWREQWTWLFFLPARLLIWEDAAMGRCGGLAVGGVWGGMAISVCNDFQLNSWKEKMGELTSEVSNGPDYFFSSTAVDLRGCGNVAMWWISCGRGVGRNGRVSCDDFQLNCFAHKKQNRHTQQPTYLLRGRQGRRVGVMARKTMSQLAAQNSMNSQRSKGMTVRWAEIPLSCFVMVQCKNGEKWARVAICLILFTSTHRYIGGTCVFVSYVGRISVWPKLGYPTTWGNYAWRAIISVTVLSYF